nr:glutathione S-transferase isoform II, GST II {internal fragment 1} {EC 2.5.1.18} [Zea mays=maize, seedling roots, Peptide Partial, 15 aa] [Zea mays]
VAQFMPVGAGAPKEQ